MRERTINGAMLAVVVTVLVAVMTMAGYQGGRLARASAAAAAVSAVRVEMAARAVDSCVERPAPRRRSIEPEGCIDPTAALTRR
jgi:hypothetical protein